MCIEAAIDMLAELRLIRVRADWVNDVSAVVFIDVSAVASAADVFANIEIVVVTIAVIAFDFVVDVAYSAELLARMWTGPIFDGTPGSGAEVNASGVAAVMTALEFALPAPFIEPFLSC